MEPFTFKNLFEHADLILGKRDFMWWCKDYHAKVVYPDESLERVQKAKILFLYGGALDEWVKRFQILSMSCQLLILGATDETYTLSRVHKLLNVLPNAQFWITNWIGTHPRCSILPLFSNYDGVYKDISYEKKNLFGISFARVNSQARIDFYKSLSHLPEIQKYLMIEVPNTQFYRALGSLYFSCCPMGGGLDTYRFWESLLVGAIPIVKQHFFYDCLKREYPNIPMIIIDEWEDLPKCIDSLSRELYDNLMQEVNLEILFPHFWLEKLSVFRNLQNQNNGSNEYC
jgi:hypothetical protein